MSDGPKKNNVWRNLRDNHLMTYPECRVCGERQGDIVVHHLRYRGTRGTAERPGDLVTMCAWHHNQLHKELGRTPKVIDQLRWLALLPTARNHD